MAAVDFGHDWSCITDLTLPPVEVSGNRLVAEALVRRWSTPRGQLLDDPNYGFDVTAEVSDDIASADIARISSLTSAEALKDERVSACTVSVAFSLGTLTMTAFVTTANGPFTLVAAVSAVTIQLLTVSPQ